MARERLREIPQLQKDFEADKELLDLISPAPAQKEAEPPFADAEAVILKGEQRYATIQASILAIFAIPHSAAGLPAMPDDKKAEFIASNQARSAAQAKAFEKLKSATVVIIPNASHFVFESNEQEVEKDVKKFLTSLKTE
jgi:pimeloyl-ACP methyl ester carboxylesterase